MHNLCVCWCFFLSRVLALETIDLLVLECAVDCRLKQMYSIHLATSTHAYNIDVRCPHFRSEMKTKWISRIFLCFFMCYVFVCVMIYEYRLKIIQLNSDYSVAMNADDKCENIASEFSFWFMFSSTKFKFCVHLTDGGDKTLIDPLYRLIINTYNTKAIACFQGIGIRPLP